MRVIFNSCSTLSSLACIPGFLRINSKIPELGESLGLRWGGHWTSNYDPIHFDLGSVFSGDQKNNLIIMDYDSPTPLSDNNFLGHFIFGLESKHVNDVISNGKLIVRNKMTSSNDEKYFDNLFKKHPISLTKTDNKTYYFTKK